MIKIRELMQGGRASLWRLVPPTDMKAEEVDEATPKMLTRISKWQKKRDEAKYTLLVEWKKPTKVAKVIATAILD